MEIPRSYGVGPRILGILGECWARQQIVPKAGVWSGEEFIDIHRVTQGDPLSPMIFNTMLGSVVISWIA